MRFKILIFLFLTYHSTSIYAGGADVFAYQEGEIITLFPDAYYKNKPIKSSKDKTKANKTLTTKRTTKYHSKTITTKVISD
jgi:hypothetical protein